MVADQKKSDFLREISEMRDFLKENKNVADPLSLEDLALHCCFGSVVASFAKGADKHIKHIRNKAGLKPPINRKSDISRDEKFWAWQDHFFLHLIAVSRTQKPKASLLVLAENIVEAYKLSRLKIKKYSESRGQKFKELFPHTFKIFKNSVSGIRQEKAESISLMDRRIRAARENARKIGIEKVFGITYTSNSSNGAVFINTLSGDAFGPDSKGCKANPPTKISIQGSPYDKIPRTQIMPEDAEKISVYWLNIHTMNTTETRSSDKRRGRKGSSFKPPQSLPDGVPFRLIPIEDLLGQIEKEMKA